MPSTSDSLLNDVRSALERATLRTDSLLIVGFSGGVDSQTLLHSLAKMRDRAEGPQIQAIHVDHRLRVGSEQDARECLRIAERMSVPIEVVEVDVGAWDRGRGVEASARDARFAALAQAAHRAGTTWVALGHSLDDRVETVLMRLARGTSLDGLTAMREVSRRATPLVPDGSDMASIDLFRPLLQRTRAEIEEYATQHELVPIEDPTNVDPRFRRNAMRHQLIPVLEQIAPGSKRSIARSMSLLATDADYLEELARVGFETCATELGPCLAMDRQSFAQLPSPIQGRVVALMIHRLSPGIDLTSERVKAVCRAICVGHVSTRIEIGADLEAFVDYDCVVVGSTDRIDPSLQHFSGLPLLDPGTDLRIPALTHVELRNGWALDVSWSGAESDWVLRTRLPGDRVQFGSAASRKLQDWFVNRKISNCLRDHIPLLVHGGVVRWVAGFSSPRFEDVDSGLTARLTKTTKEDRTDDERVAGHPSA